MSLPTLMAVIWRLRCTVIQGGGWLVVQRRQDGSVDFNRTWVEYENGFGKLTGEFWYGLKALHYLTSRNSYEMRMDIKLTNDTKLFLQYSTFKVYSAEDKYRLYNSGFHGTTTDPLDNHHGVYFTTTDNDNEKHNNSNCTLIDGPNAPLGGWWYNGCYKIAPNGFYDNGVAIYLNDQWHQVPFIEIKIRPPKCHV